MKILKGPETAAGIPVNPGLSTFAIIDFSHISIHTFTNTKEFCLDIFSCKEFDSKKLENFVKQTFKLSNKQIFKSIVRYDQLNIERNRKSFSSKQYLNEYYRTLGNENIALLDWYKSIYQKIGAGKSLLEIGGGPTIYQLISAVTKVKNITFTDISRKNLDIVQDTIKIKCPFWDKFIKHVLLDELGRDATKKETSMRKKLVAHKIKDGLRLMLAKDKTSL